jgi:ribonuclease BN (tRNA processing enzyme)
MQALLGGIVTAISYLSSTNNITSEYTTTPSTLIPTPDCSIIISHLHKDTSSQLTNFVISMANSHTYAIISTMDIPIKIRLPTTIIIAGSHHQQIVHIQLNPHNRNIMGRAYAALFQNPLTQSMNPSIPIPKVHQTKGLTGRKIEKMAWALTLLQNPDTLRTYEDFAREAAYETEDTQPHASNPQSAEPKTIPLPPPAT